MGKFAADTSVSSETSRAEIERTLRRYGANQFGYMVSDDAAVVGFSMHDRRIKFELAMPNPKSRDFTHTPGRGQVRSPTQASAAWEQACRQRWRALALVVKAKLEAVEAGITTFEAEFLAHIVLPSGQTVGELTYSHVADAYAKGTTPPLLGKF